ncbi:MAG: hypothetical protein BWZ10_02603 [candidate division BRC1 bacterium ADurb.BinA364]|nr:MAG: hypothetical protein BWZ10_02603 [candidate division BRC1 bacterium ADurb.BinA364]
MAWASRSMALTVENLSSPAVSSVSSSRRNCWGRFSTTTENPLAVRLKSARLAVPRWIPSLVRSGISGMAATLSTVCLPTSTMLNI